MHEIEGQMKADNEEPEMQPAERLAVHFSRHFRKPVIESAESREEDSAHDDVVEVRDHEVGIPKMPIERCYAQHDPRKTGDQELKEKAFFFLLIRRPPRSTLFPFTTFPLGF